MFRPIQLDVLYVVIAAYVQWQERGRLLYSKINKVNEEEVAN